MSLIVSQILRFIQYVSSKLSPDILHYHTSNSHECMGVNGEALQLHAVLKKPFLYHKSHKNLNQYCHVKSVSGTYCKLRALRLNLQWFV